MVPARELPVRALDLVSAGIPQSSTKRAVPLKKYLQQMYRNGAKKAFETMPVAITRLK